MSHKCFPKCFCLCTVCFYTHDLCHDWLFSVFFAGLFLSPLLSVSLRPCLSLSVESGLTYTQSEMGVDGESGWRVVMTSQTVGRLPALSRPAKMTQRQTTTEKANQSFDMQYGEGQRLKQDRRKEGEQRNELVCDETEIKQWWWKEERNRISGKRMEN